MYASRGAQWPQSEDLKIWTHGPSTSPMRALLVPLVLLPLACTKLTEPQSEKTAKTSLVPDQPKASQKAPQERVAKPIARPTKADVELADAEPKLTVSHILVGYQGAVRSRSSRSKDEARQFATELLARLRKGEDFGELAVAHSDDPTAKANRGSLNTAPATAWVKPFGDAAVNLEPGALSDLVETPFGFHIIKREK